MAFDLDDEELKATRKLLGIDKENNIKGYSIQNGEPTPDNPAEIKSLDIEKDIKFIDEMVKEYNTFGDLDNTDYEDTDRIYKAIENILKRIQELEQENRIQRRQINSAFDRGWILKQKVKEKIKEAKYNKKVGNTAYEYTEEDVWDIVKDELEKLLEESK